MNRLPSGFTSNGVPVDPTIPKVGTTTSVGAANGTTLIDTNGLTEATADLWADTTLLILSGTNRGKTAAIVAFDPTTDTLTVAPAFPAQIASGVQYAILSDTAAAVLRALGSNDNNNAFDSSNVAANADGSLLERVEYVQTLLLASEPVSFTPSSAPTVDEDGGRVAVHVSVVDRNTGPVASGSIDITGATYELGRSTGGGAFSTVGVTQPSGATKAAGEVDLEFDIDPAEWAAGDTYRIKLGAVTATVGGTTYYMGTLTWVGEVVEDVDLKATVDDINTDLGEPNDAAVDPAGGAGTVHAKLGGVPAYTADAAWDEAAAGHVAAGSFGKLVADIDAKTTNLPADPASEATVTAVKAKTDLLPADPAAQAKLDTIHDTRLPGVVEPQTGDSYARLGPPSGASVSADIADIAANVGTWTGPTNAGATSCAASTETTLLEVTPITTPTHALVTLNLKNLTVDASIRVYELVSSGAGTEYQVIGPVKNWTTSDPDGVRVDFWAQGDYKVTITTGAEGASRDVYVQHSRKVTA